MKEWNESSVGKCPKCGRFVSTSGKECEVEWMPSALNYFVWVLGDDNTGKGLRQVSLKVSQDYLIVVTAGQQIIGFVWETYGSYIRGMGLECLYDSTASYVVKHTIRVFVSGDQQFSRRIHTNGCDSASYLTDKIQMFMKESNKVSKFEYRRLFLTLAVLLSD